MKFVVHTDLNISAKDIFAVTVLAEIEGDEDALEEGWDAI